MAKGQKPGEPASSSGQYKEKDKNGNVGLTEITAIEGKPLPPTKKPGGVWIEVDKTKHKSDRK